jgi:hypothetical protein
VLFTGFDAFHGHDRLWASDQLTIGHTNVTYSEAGLGLFVAVAATAAFVVWRSARPGRSDERRLFLAVALVVVAYVTLNTRSSGHYLTLSLPFLLLAMPPGSSVLTLWRVAAVSLAAIVSEYGLFMFIATKGEWPNFAVLGSPATNQVSALVYRLYTSDVGITLFAIMLLFVTAHTFAQLTVGPTQRTAAASPSPTHVTRGTD